MKAEEFAIKVAAIGERSEWLWNRFLAIKSEIELAEFAKEMEGLCGTE